MFVAGNGCTRHGTRVEAKGQLGELVLFLLHVLSSFFPTIEPRLSGLVADNFIGQLAGLDPVLITRAKMLTSSSISRRIVWL